MQRVGPEEAARLRAAVREPGRVERAGDEGLVLADFASLELRALAHLRQFDEAEAAGATAPRTTRFRVVFKFQPLALWIGAHWSAYHRRLCVNVLPCLTVCLVAKGGHLP